MKEKETTYELSEFKAASKALCPRCRKGPIFTGNTYGFKTQKMNTHCDYCGLRYEREPGYFYVSMFVSYAFTVAEMVSSCLLAFLITGNDDSFWLYASVALLSVLILSPFNYRYSRVVLMYWLSPGLSYVPNIQKKEINSTTRTL
ncbi:DUF983 domain-containing protein [Sphingobacterium faecium]|uniref:DUF983 domain-containing protein n=1 Tax=Sphingobacterium faecium TaxID=34087 RepID=UPI0024695041|nr:DUF983 domain-containing protein [Sphingobacterium faecium]MDH5826199.1 DUF983 domain-containing protein [Sphingobacterium faecium]